ncbi:MAG: tol-pal system protein YbgF [Pseudomonadota bacterium]
MQISKCYQRIGSNGLGLLLLACTGFISPVQAQGLFEDRDARLAILDMRKQIETLQASQAEMLITLQKLDKRLEESNPQQGLLELVQQNQELRKEVNLLRGQIEQSQAKIAQFESTTQAQGSPLAQLKKDLADLQSQHKSGLLDLSDRLGKIEPYSVALNGKTYWLTAAESDSFNAAMDRIKAQDWKSGASSLESWLERYGDRSPYASSARFWVANAYAALGSHIQARDAYELFLKQYPDDSNAPDAMFSLASSQIALKKSVDAKKTLQLLSKRFPKSDAGMAALKQLKSLK